MSDLLDDLVKASREAPVVHDDADETRRRILAAANHQARTTSRRRLSPWVLPLVAAFIATGALAAGPLGVTRALFGPAPAPVPTVTSTAHAVVVRGTAPPTAEAPSAVPTLEAAPTPEAAPAPSLGATAATTPPLLEVAGSMGAPSTPAPRSASPSAPPGSRAERGAPPAPGALAHPPATVEPPAARAEAPAGAGRAPEPATPTAAVPPVPPPADPADDLYRAAHDRHFRGGDPAAALEAWDRYLAAAPRGRFAVEARYNRALALLKTGRRAEGLAALEPFANGAFGAYRREEAQRLLGAARDAGAP